MGSCVCVQVQEEIIDYTTECRPIDAEIRETYGNCAMYLEEVPERNETCFCTVNFTLAEMFRVSIFWLVLPIQRY